MLAAVLAMAVVPISSPTDLTSGYPSQADRALLLEASRACHLHPGAAYFVQHSRGDTATIHTTRSLGDTDAQITCMLQRLPGDFISRFEVDAELAPPPEASGSSAGDHRRRFPRH